MTLRVRGDWAPALDGRPICLAVGLTEQTSDLQFEVEEAVISLTRAVLASGGRLALVADDAISPLIGQLAAEYAEPPLLETGEEPGRRASPVALLVHDGLDEPTTDTLALLRQTGAVDLLAPDTEREHPAPWTPGSYLAPVPARQLWRQLFEFIRPIAVVAIGESPDWIVGAEPMIAAWPPVVGQILPVFRVETTATPGAWREVRGEVIDVVARYVTPEVSERAGLEREESTGLGEEPAEPMPGTPYPFVMQRLVEDLARGPGLG